MNPHFAIFKTTSVTKSASDLLLIDYRLVNSGFNFLFQKGGNVYKSSTITVIRFSVPTAVQNNNVGNGKAMAGEVRGTVKVECAEDVLQRGFAIQGGCVDQIVILPVNGQPSFLQTLVRLKAIVPCFRPAF